MGDLIEPPPPTELTQLPVRHDENETHDSTLRVGSSAKIDQLIHLLQLIPSDQKCLVFSQFTSFLDKVRLKSQGVATMLMSLHSDR
jgi:SWI/SNF-related matrix-associated actin-dependent regulator of chromatin subfamily A3